MLQNDKKILTYEKKSLRSKKYYIIRTYSTYLEYSQRSESLLEGLCGRTLSGRPLYTVLVTLTTDPLVNLR